MLESNLYHYVILHTLTVDYLLVKRSLMSVKVLDKFFYTSLVMETSYLCRLFS